MRTLNDFYLNLVAELSRANEYGQVILTVRATAETSELMYDIQRALKAYEASLEAEHDCDWRNDE